MASITIERVAKSFGEVRALAEVDLTVADGEFLALLGPSGCGKTTLLRIVAGLESQTTGRVLIGARDVSALPPRKRGLAMVFQNYAVFPHLTVYENVAFGLRMARADKARIAAQVEKAAALLHIEALLRRHPAQLSGGQRQRVAVARALAVEPAVLLMDEPLSNLDALLRLEMRAELKAVLSEAGTTTIYVTHDQTEAMGLADRIAVMHRGRIAQIGNAEDIYDRPATRFVAEFVGRANVLPIQRDAQGRTSVWGQPLPLEAPEDGDLFVRPQRMRIAPVSEPAGESAARLTGRVLRSVFVGDHVEVLVEGGGGQLTVETPSGTAIPMEGAEVAVVWPRAESRVFAREAP